VGVGGTYTPYGRCPEPIGCLASRCSTSRSPWTWRCLGARRDPCAGGHRTVDGAMPRSDSQIWGRAEGRLPRKLIGRCPSASPVAGGRRYPPVRVWEHSPARRRLVARLRTRPVCDPGGEAPRRSSSARGAITRSPSRCPPCLRRAPSHGATSRPRRRSDAPGTTDKGRSTTGGPCTPWVRGWATAESEPEPPAHRLPTDMSRVRTCPGLNTAIPWTRGVMTSQYAPGLACAGSRSRRWLRRPAGTPRGWRGVPCACGRAEPLAPVVRWPPC